ncbi:hypothetical protein TPY_2242 [Sulfobacillus acidophilus TPY]|nr:hypothetical protein TPY_2242 [Sulfobacillus acidophilus TPY]
MGVADADGKRVGQFPPGKVRLLARYGGFSWKETPMRRIRGTHGNEKWG